MRVLVCGSRGWRDGNAIERRLLELPPGTVVVHGAARGADRIAGSIAQALGFQVEVFLPNWVLGRSAGLQRTRQMLDTDPHLVLAFWDGVSTGTGYTITEAARRGIEVEVVREGVHADA